MSATRVTTVTLLTQPDCAMCEQAKQVLARVGADHRLHVDEVSLASDAGRALATSAGVPFAPGILLDGTPFGFGRLSERKLRKTLTRQTDQPHKGD
jgi:glutaredoxin